jgi:hypothetical protein
MSVHVLEVRIRLRNLQSFIGIERGKELIEYALCDILHLRAHSHSLGSNVHRENLTGPTKPQNLGLALPKR